MPLVNGTPRCFKDVVRELGPDSTYESAKARAAELGIAAAERQSFDNYRSRLRAAVEESKDKPFDRPAFGGADRASLVARLQIFAEEVGGFDNLRALVDELERLNHLMDTWKGG